MVGAFSAGVLAGSRNTSSHQALPVSRKPLRGITEEARVSSMSQALPHR
ncbi:hypothetical protein P4112_19930 [Pseudomonas aeruginosa]|nr:hypothetical protein [Pseudomonas aeruginosa]